MIGTYYTIRYRSFTWWYRFIDFSAKKSVIARHMLCKQVKAYKSSFESSKSHLLQKYFILANIYWKAPDLSKSVLAKLYNKRVAQIRVWCFTWINARKQRKKGVENGVLELIDRKTEGRRSCFVRRKMSINGLSSIWTMLFVSKIRLVLKRLMFRDHFYAVCFLLVISYSQWFLFVFSPFVIIFMLFSSVSF